jgi:flagellar biosynthesis chaperone FliJ
MSRLSKLTDEQAGEAVKNTRQMLDEAHRHARMLEGYRRKLCIGEGQGRTYSGQALRAHAAFIKVAESACAQARHQLVSSQERAQDALQRWAEARQRSRVIEDNTAPPAAASTWIASDRRRKKTINKVRTVC